MKKNGLILFVLFITLLLFFASCSITRRVPEGRHLLVDNEINIDNKKVELDELKSILKQRPNRKILGIWRFHLRIYNLADNGRQGKLWQYLRNTVGEKPVLLDSSQTSRSTRQLKLFLQKKGYFEAIVTDTTRLQAYDTLTGRSKKKARVSYSISTGEPYYIRNVSRNFPDGYIDRLYLTDSSNTLVRSGIIYDEDILTAERDRITTFLRNAGYFYFTKEYLYFDVDTNIEGKQVDVRLGLTLPSSDTTSQEPHKQYYLDRIFVVTDYEPGIDKEYKDTLVFAGLTFLYNDILDIKPVIISQHTFLKPGDLYQQKNTEESYRKLVDLRIFRSVNVTFSKPADRPVKSNLVNAYIYLSPLTKNSLDLESRGTNRQGNLGVEGSIYFTNRNTFHGAELLEIRMKGGLEAQRYDSTVTGDDDNKLLLFNTVEFGPELSITLPRFLFLGKPDKFSKYFTPKTTITAAYNYQSIPSLSRRIISFQYGYNWREFATKQHSVKEDFNFVKINPKERFEEFLEQIDNRFIERTYTSHFTAPLIYTFTFNNRKPHNQHSGYFFFLRTGFEANLFRLLTNTYNHFIGDSADVNDIYNIGGVEFTQFAKVDGDLRFYRIFHEKHNVAMRLSAGGGRPLSNRTVLPLEKSYFIGGANSIRAWAARSLGPGGYIPDETSSNTLRIGDMTLEGNLEYRFDLFRIVEGAWFLDAGNIWLFNEDTLLRKNAEFRFPGFYKQIAVGTGAGVRLDFTFFIFRFDLGLKLRDPGLSANDDWVISKLFDSSWKTEYRNEHTNQSYPFTNWNFGIGYPF